MEIVLVVVLCIIVAMVWSTIVNFFWKESPTLKEIRERKYSFDELLDLIKRAQVLEWGEIKNKLYTHKKVLEIVDKAMDRITIKETRKTTKKTFKPKTQEEFIEITNNLEKQWILSEWYDNYYSEWCTITVQWNWYYTN